VVPLGEALGPIPDPLVQLEKDVQKEYPDLRLIIDKGKPLLRGSFPLLHGGLVLDRFLIEVSFPEGIGKLPVVREIGGRIPKTINRHVFPSGAICTEVPELTLLRGNYSLLAYFYGPVRNYFIGQSLVEHGEPWPFGEWSHGKQGLVEAYGAVLGVSDERRIRRHLECLGHKKIKSHWQCPCGSAKLIRDCHAARVRQLHEQIPPRIARQALQRLNAG
jgi:hypothetical protein